MKTRDAMTLARTQNLDLVEVAPTAQPPVCRILDYGKYRYEQGKKEKEAHKSQKVITIKEVRLRPKIGDHDLRTKGNQARGFLEEGHKVKMTVLFRGREMAHQDIGREVLNEMIDMLKDVALIEQAPRVEGRNMSMMLSKAAPKSTEPKAPRPPRPEQAPAANVSNAASANDNGNGNAAPGPETEAATVAPAPAAAPAPTE
jgi:translation initiation factor IF-3